MSEPAVGDPERGDRSTRVVETHTSTLFFLGDRVYKLKKSLDLGFLDHRTREARLASCRAEVALNGRLAPDVYLRVLDISGPDGEPCEHLVEMRRMPDERRLARCLERGEDLDEPLRRIAHLVAAVHSGSPRNADRETEAAEPAVRQRWVDGFEQLRAVELPAPQRQILDDSERLVLSYLAGRRPLFAARIAGGWVRDGHGDLQAEDIFVLDDGPRILDCIEFGDEYRWGDVLADVAFLAMDLERLGREDLAARFLALHREHTADRWPATLAHHFIAYRAHIRAKVGILRHVQRGEAVGAAVDELLRLSHRHLVAAQPQLVVVGGSPGTGKSTLAAGIGRHIGAVVLRSDEVRRRMPDDRDRASDERYSAETVAAVYDEMLAEAGRLVSLGEHVVLDATWSADEQRASARALATKTSSRIHEIECVVDQAEAHRRIEHRRRAGKDPSEATVAVADLLASRFTPWTEALSVDTAATPASVLAGVLQRTGLLGVPSPSVRVLGP